MNTSNCGQFYTPLHSFSYFRTMYILINDFLKGQIYIIYSYIRIVFSLTLINTFDPWNISDNPDEDTSVHVTLHIFITLMKIPPYM